MANSLFISSIFLVVLVTPGFCQEATVCKEEDGDIRIDCLIKIKPNHVNSYDFSIAKGGKEVIMNTNVSGITADQSFKEKTTVTPLDLASGYRMRLKNYPINENTTFICKVSNIAANAVVEKGKMVTCSAVSVFLHGCPWLLSLLVVLHVTQSWVLSTP